VSVYNDRSNLHNFWRISVFVANLCCTFGENGWNDGDEMCQKLYKSICRIWIAKQRGSLYGSPYKQHNAEWCWDTYAISSMHSTMRCGHAMQIIHVSRSTVTYRAVGRVPTRVACSCAVVATWRIPLKTRHRASTSTRWHFVFALCCRSNEIRVLIANPPNSAQLGGILYHTPELHQGPCSSVGMRPRTDTQTDARNQ